MAQIKHEHLGMLRPLMPKSKLQELMGAQWVEPSIKAEGYISSLILSYSFGVRLTSEGQLGEVGFYRKFPSHISVEGIYIGMPLYEAYDCYPDLKSEPISDENRLRHCCQCAEGIELELISRDDKVDVFFLRAVNVKYPEFKPQVHPELQLAYDFFALPPRLQKNSGDETLWEKGWLLGRPPGISVNQWPLSPKTGLPLRHAFTLKLPPEYRVKGNAFVAISLFVDEQFRKFPLMDEIAKEFKSFKKDQLPNPKYEPLWQHFAFAHPHTFWMSDSLGCDYAAIWLTEDEFTGKLCDLPAIHTSEIYQGHNLQSWFNTSPADYFGKHYFIKGKDQEPLPWLGEHWYEAAYPIEISMRSGDPNVGKPASDTVSEIASSGYIPMFSTRGQGLNLEQWAGKNHLGGTMCPMQSYPEFTPFYLEFEENFGGFNFAGGAAQLDLMLMQIDWASG